MSAPKWVDPAAGQRWRSVQDEALIGVLTGEKTADGRWRLRLADGSHVSEDEAGLNFWWTLEPGRN